MEIVKNYHKSKCKLYKSHFTDHQITMYNIASKIAFFLLSAEIEMCKICQSAELSENEVGRVKEIVLICSNRIYCLIFTNYCNTNVCKSLKTLII